MKKGILLFLVLSLSTIYSQVLDSTLNKWRPSFIASANLSQIAFDNWAKGGENSLSYSFGVDWTMKYKKVDWRFKNQLKGEWGQSKTGSDNSKITSNNIFNETVFSVKIGWVVEPFVSNLIRTPITDGFDYSVLPKNQIVAFFDPGYVTQSIGFTYGETDIFQTRIGLAFEESFADKFAIKYTDDPETLNEIETFKFETGIESITDVEYLVFENVLYKGKLRLFSAFDRLDTWDVAMDNSFTAKVNSWLNVNFTYLIVNKVSESLRTQTQQALQVGVVYRLY
jgi:Protein of unknown function (DUF3078)